MKKSIFQELNLRGPEEVFNFLGNQQFGKEWTERPLQILQGVRKKPKPVSKTFLRNKYMADTVYKKFVEILNDKSTTIYVRKQNSEEPKIWKGLRCSLERKNLLLIDQEIHPEHGPMDIDYMPFWIEMPKEKNPLLFKRRGPKPRHDKNYLISILEDVLKLNDRKVTYSSVSDAYKKYLVGANVPAPSDTWLCEHMGKEIEPYK